MVDKVLYVDDDQTAHLIFRLTCERVRFARQVLTACNGQQALDYYKQWSEEERKGGYPRLVLLDLDMPIMGGWEFLDQFVPAYLSAFADTKIFIVSSSINPDDRQRVNKYPCVLDFVSKPITVKVLTELSRRVVNLSLS